MDSGCIQLIVGLANPGKEYADTRHNAGGWFIDLLTAQANAVLRHQVKFHGVHALARLDNQACHLLVPSTFMNHSGQAVHALMAYHKLAPHAVLIAHDDIDLPAGTIRLKLDGGDGGHNGLKDIILHLNTKQFYRLRIGVGRPKTSADVTDYVLHKPSRADRDKIDAALKRAQDVLPLILTGKMQHAMQQLHTEGEAPWL